MPNGCPTIIRSQGAITAMAALCALALAAVVVPIAGAAVFPQKFSAVGAWITRSFPGHRDPILAFGPGTLRHVQGRAVRVFGFDTCPPDGSAWLPPFGNSLPETGCIVLDRPEVPVVLEGGERQFWTVRTEGGLTIVLAPDGSPVR